MVSRSEAGGSAGANGTNGRGESRVGLDSGEEDSADEFGSRQNEQ